jgi:phosphoglycerate-specific signal transduction histidine kinase
MDKEMTLIKLILENNDTVYTDAINDCMTKLDELKTLLPKADDNIESYDDFSDNIDYVIKKLNWLKDKVEISG